MFHLNSSNLCSFFSICEILGVAVIGSNRVLRLVGNSRNEAPMCDINFISKNVIKDNKDDNSSTTAGGFVSSLVSCR